MEDLAIYLKSKPTSYTASSVGSLGTVLFDAVFRHEYNITNIKKLNYDSATQFTTAILRGEADYTVATAHDTAGLKPISTTLSRRHPNHLDIPTGLELGLKDFNYDSFHIIYVPKERAAFAEELTAIVDKACKHLNVQNSIAKFAWFLPACSDNRNMIDAEIANERRLVEKYKSDLIFDN